MTTNERAGRPERGDSGLSYVPVAWVVVTMAMEVRGLFGIWPALFPGYGWPESVAVLFWATSVFDVVSLLWSFFLLGLAFGRSARFPRQFTIWQSAVIVWLVCVQAYALVAPGFAFAPRALATAAGEIAIGLACIYLLRSGGGAEAVYTGEGGDRPGIAVSLLFAALGLLLGAAVGAAVGLGVGSLLAEGLDVGCFEGGCGYFVLFAGAVGLLVGAVAGLVLVLWLVVRRGHRHAA